MSASILTNDGSGVELYTYPKADTSGWATVDTSWTFRLEENVQFNTDWETGAFCLNQKGHPDYGWDDKKVLRKIILIQWYLDNRPPVIESSPITGQKYGRISSRPDIESAGYRIMCTI